MEGTILRPAEGPHAADSHERPRSVKPPASRWEQYLVGAAVASGLTYAALRGGSYDVVVRGEQGLVLWWTLLLGLAFGLLPRRRPSRSTWVLLGALAALVLWTLLAFGWTESDERTSVELARIVAYAGLVVLVVGTLRSTSVGAAIAGAAVAGGVVCLLALASRLWPDAFPADRIAKAFSTTRLSYPFNYWNAVAAWGSMSTAMALAWSAHARHAAWRALALASVPVMVTVVYLTYSRAGAAGIAIGAVSAVVLARTRLVMLAHLAVAAVASLPGDPRGARRARDRRRNRRVRAGGSADRADRRRRPVRRRCGRAARARRRRARSASRAGRRARPSPWPACSRS